MDEIPEDFIGTPHMYIIQYNKLRRNVDPDHKVDLCASSLFLSLSLSLCYDNDDLLYKAYNYITNEDRYVTIRYQGEFNCHNRAIITVKSSIYYK